MILGLEHKFCRLGAAQVVETGVEIEGYASLFGTQDSGGDIVAKGAYSASLVALKAKGARVKMLWQHDPAQPIGVWDVVREDAHGLFVKGRILTDIEKGREAAALIEAGAIDGLSIGYRTVRARKTDGGARVLSELELWEVSLVTFPMLPQARIAAQTKGHTLGDGDAMLRDIAEALSSARMELTEANASPAGQSFHREPTHKGLFG
ncbi:HK97 family phage prohead protease [Celeribacter marinus]|uniref:HK97 family phage prohead protease n=1 Tax=Celeribacter marinus TaxID=1397108 RepID=UPI003F6D9482